MRHVNENMLIVYNDDVFILLNFIYQVQLIPVEL